MRYIVENITLKLEIAIICVRLRVTEILFAIMFIFSANTQNVPDC